MRKIYLFTLILGSTLLFHSCTQPKENKDSTIDFAEQAKDIYIQLYSVREDIKSDFKGTIAKVAEA